ncbi:hypothetical protein MNBD_GAMMA06-305 [hydrothermal vent metagenome]|uniref:Uncharacterized protein n=1 Tax=hydrothermal vent metagenome TaxID=652676 RepID=A0A3B0WTC7_9ZZZZ
MTKKTEQNWDNATWEGSRRAMIKQSLKLTVRERLIALEELNKLSRKLLSIKTVNNKVD